MAAAWKVLRLLIITPFLIAHCQTVEPFTVRECGKLPSSRYSVAAAYDGQDSIYVLGGMTEDDAEEGYARPLDDVIRYDVVTEKSEVVAKFSSPVASGNAVWTNDRVYYFGPTHDEAGTTNGAVWTLTTANPTPSRVGTLSKAYEYSSLVTDDAGSIYIIGGLDKNTDSTLSEIVRYNISSQEITTLAHLESPTFDTAAIYSHPFIEVFGGGHGVEDSYPGGFLTTNRVSRVQLHEDGSTDVTRMTPLPYIIFGGSAVLVGTDMAYIIGGNMEGVGEDGTVPSGVIRYNITEGKGVNQALSPAWSTGYSHASVYVEKGDIGIIYTFGGLIGGEETDKVMCARVKGQSGSGSSSGWSLTSSVWLLAAAVIYNYCLLHAVQKLL